MDRNVKDKVDGWDISLQRNVHMYCHALSVKNGQLDFSIDCEDLVTEEKTIGIWLYNSEIPESMVGELQKVLLKWASQYDVRFHIYTSKLEYVTNK
ncbi:hypothetical protein [Pseudomonas sp. 5Ae-yellow]|uniref:hypothetical protein n=1 Tax=Pseudomonas sp. 5Ae-yellow TaxID=2759848 RepID=UPI0015F57E10|nr:hypothetical protein [Pseudomonas sp. 5Ae-yellow]MBA6419318.1 hypothetical protein [Pseudomonas sp. 5Ae-yellow]